MGRLDISSDFSKWATGFSGMNGGNLKAPLWFCGIEFGGGKEIKFKIDRKYSYINEKSELIPCWNKEYRDAHKNEYKTWQYDQKCAKVVCQFIKGNINDYRDYMDKLYTKEGDTFKMNLYPLPFPKDLDDLWTKEHYEKTGFPNKIMYKAWCMEHRFPFLRNLVEEYKPKVLICTGSNSKQDFRLAFAPKEKLFDETFFVSKKIYKNKHECEYFRINGGYTLVIITPFFGLGGIMSNAGLIELADLVKSLTLTRP